MFSTPFDFESADFLDNLCVDLYKIASMDLIYKECVMYEKFRTLLTKNVFSIPEEFMCFKDIIVQH